MLEEGNLLALYWGMYLNMFGALMVMAVLTSLLYTGDSPQAGGGEAIDVTDAAGAPLGAAADKALMADYQGKVVVTEHGSPMLKGVQTSLQRADAIMLKQNELHRELIEAGTSHK